MVRQHGPSKRQRTTRTRRFQAIKLIENDLRRPFQRTDILIQRRPINGTRLAVDYGFLDTRTAENVVAFCHDRIDQRTVTYRTHEILVYGCFVSHGSEIDKVDEVEI